MPNLSLRPTPGYLVWRLATKLRTAVDSAVGPLGLTHAQYSVLSTLRGGSPAPVCTRASASSPTTQGSSPCSSPSWFALWKAEG
jgi:hypothetical protein